MERVASSKPPASPVSIYPILAVNFVGTLGFGIVLPFLVFLVTRWGGNALVYGIMGATYSTFQLLGAPILGGWSDRLGRRRILLLSQLGTLASWLVFVVAFALPVNALLKVDNPLAGQFTLTLPLLIMFFARALDGLTGGNVSVANAYLADISNDENRNANFGKMAVSSNLGFILGPALAGLLSATVVGELLPVLAALGISLVASLLILFRLPESRLCALRSDPEQASVRKILGQEHKECFPIEGSAGLSFSRLLRMERVPALLAIYFLVMLGFNFFYISFPVHAAGTLSWTVTDTGVFFTVMGLLMAVVQGPVLARAARTFSDLQLVSAGSLILGASFLFFVSSAGPAIYTGVFFLALGNGLMWSSVLALLSRFSGSEYQGAVQGFASSGGSAASIIGLLAGGVLYGVLGSLVFLVSAATILAVFFLSLKLHGPIAH